MKINGEMSRVATHVSWAPCCLSLIGIICLCLVQLFGSTDATLERGRVSVVAVRVGELDMSNHLIVKKLELPAVRLKQLVGRGTRGKYVGRFTTRGWVYFRVSWKKY